MEFTLFSENFVYFSYKVSFHEFLEGGLARNSFLRSRGTLYFCMLAQG
jgi:hypothetical protein